MITPFITYKTSFSEKHAIGVIINIAQKVDKPWPIWISDQRGGKMEVFLNPGEMALFEKSR